MDEQSLQQPLDEVERVTHAGETGRSAEAGVSFSTAHTDATLVYWKITVTKWPWTTCIGL